MTEEEMTHTEINIDNTPYETVETPVYEFILKDKTSPDYRCTTAIIEWIKTNLESLTDDYNKPVFSKVNYGYNEDTIKSFGKKPVADVYINNLDYESDFENNYPQTVNSIIIVYLKGNMNTTYSKACELTDYLIQEFEENEDFRRLTDIVRYTSVEDVRLEIVPGSKTYGVLCAFELQHKLY